MRKYNDSHDFTNDSQETLLITLAPGERVLVKSNVRPTETAIYDGEEYGNEVEIEPGASVRSL